MMTKETKLFSEMTKWGIRMILTTLWERQTQGKPLMEMTRTQLQEYIREINSLVGEKLESTKLPFEGTDRNEFQSNLESVLEQIRFLENVPEETKLNLYFDLETLVRELKFKCGGHGSVREITHYWQLESEAEENITNP